MIKAKEELERQRKSTILTGRRPGSSSFNKYNSLDISERILNVAGMEETLLTSAKRSASAFTIITL